MNAETLNLPGKKRELHNHHFDSTIWNDFKFREDDIIIGTYAKSGTTWMQQIIAQLIFNGQSDLEVSDMSPWLDLRIPEANIKLELLENQAHRRFIKTHLPVDALVFSEKAKYIYIGRDGRDVLWSLYNHHANASQVMYDALNNSPGLVGPPLEPAPADIREYWRAWVDRGGFPPWAFLGEVRGWGGIRQLPK